MASIGIIGAGHNGLVCAFYLAGAGHEVTVFESSRVAGGACRNESWDCGATVSPGANHFGMLHPQIMADMGLDGTTLPIIRADPQLIVGLGAGESLAIHDDINRTQSEIARYSVRDANTLREFTGDLETVRLAMRARALSLHPSLAEFTSDLIRAHPRLYSLFIQGSIEALLDHYFEAPATKSLFAATSFLYNASPNESGTAFSLAYLSQFLANGSPGWGVPIGGMGRITDLMQQRIVSRSVRLITGCPVTEILLRNSAAYGLVTKDKRHWKFDFVVSNVDPYTTYNRLCHSNPVPLDEWADPRFSGACAKFNYVASQPPRPVCMSETHEALAKRSAYVYLPSLEFVHRAHVSSLTSGYSGEPYYECVSPTGFDPSLARDRTHVVSLFVLFAHYDEIVLWTAEARRIRKLEVFNALLSKLRTEPNDIVQAEFLDPVDIEVKFGMYKGNVDHGAQLITNIFEHRLVDTRAGIDRLYVCGSGSYPGGLVSGVPGYVTAHRLIESLQ